MLSFGQKKIQRGNVFCLNHSCSITYRVNHNVSISPIVENLFDESVETGRSADGIVSIGTPRLIGLRMKCGIVKQRLRLILAIKKQNPQFASELSLLLSGLSR